MATGKFFSARIEGESKMFTNIFTILSIIIMLCTSSADAKSPPPGTGFQDVKTNVLIMLNASSSMSSSAESGDSVNPYGVAFDSDGNIYVAKYFSNIEKYDSSGNYEFSWGSYGTDNGKFRYVYAIAIDNQNNLYVSDAGNGRIQRFNTHGVYQSKIQLSTSTARGVAVDSLGNIYAVNGNGTVEKYNSNGILLATWTNTGGYMIAVDSSDNIYITESTSSTNKIRKYNSSGTLLLSFDTKIAASGNSTFTPFGIAVAVGGYIYVTDYTNSSLYKYSADGTYQAKYGIKSGIKLGQMKNPAGVTARTYNGTTNIWVADYNNNRIQDPITSAQLFTTTTHQTVWDQAKIVVKDLVTNSNLTDGANFGLITYNTTATLNVPISSSGAAEIYTALDSINPTGQQAIDAPFTLAQSYLRGANTPMSPNAWCQSTLIVVISDGVWSGTDSAVLTASSLYNTLPSVKSFLVGKDVTDSSNQANNYILISQAGGTYPDSPVFASSWQTIYEAIVGYIQRVINSNLTFSAPTIMPSVANGDSILQSTFKYKTTHQWKGSLNKYGLNSDGSIGSLLWDAGTILAATPAANRNIWTVGTDLTTSLNNFLPSNLTQLRTPMMENSGSQLTDRELTALINFIRGIDSYSEFSDGIDDDGNTIIAGERWKLADIYHSRVVAVGAPSDIVSDEASTNTEAYYRSQKGYTGFQNSSLCGSKCSLRSEVIYAGGNDGMLHAFNAATGVEKWAFIPPSILPNFKDIVSSNPGKSNSIYGVDGTPIVKDIYYGGRWRTVLISGVRQGGKSYFALDVTNPNSPQHLFTFAYNSYTKKVSYWASSGARTDYTSANVPDVYNFFTLGESWSIPNILLLPVGTNNALKWTAVFGGGYNGAASTSYGAQLFIIDLEKGGQIIRNISISDTLSTNGIVNAVPANLTAITGDSAESFTATGALIYFSDLEGKLWKVNLTTSGTLYDTTKLFNAESTSTNARLSFQQTAAALDSSGTFIQYYGTGDIQNLGSINSSIANRAFGIKDTNYPNYTSISSMATAAKLANVGGSCPTSSQQGWYINLNSSEKVTAKATVKNNIVLFPRYSANNTDICAAGAGSISEHDFACGTTLRTTNLGSGVPTEAVLYKNKIYIGISTDQTTTNPDAGFTKQGNLIVGTPVTQATGKVKVESWWEDF